MPIRILAAIVVVLFGAMHLLGFAFAPRIKNFGDV